jgi:hypothetical protein
MKKRVVIISILILGLLSTYSLAQMHGGMMGSQGQQQIGKAPYYPCPHMMGGSMMGYGMGPGMMHGMGMTGQGMMGGMMCPCMMGGGMMGYNMGQGMMHGMGMMGQGMMGYCNKEEYNKFLDETIDLRKELHNKRFEYSEALRNPKTKPETITKYENEIQELQKKIYQKSTQ